MEAGLISLLDTIADKDGVKGVLLADDMGLCLGARGIAKPDSAAFIAAIASTSQELNNQGEPDANAQYPTITVEYEESKVVIRNEGAFTVAIFM
ncbi:uncharacterized protein BYT42DRAFT_574168 [Radiomyces spectabilis]|uniref:uncharacterized protein n=1 Tax=Radiomyces spectabilis TaxID=64574 RepID=UPI00222106F8|nr:uncharacterized protein BYT42DRAFT_574168 [Radiomyces spectabilis]KAI8376313.1 hypothetical protein BYT42DRAFT_574168 [Radiomyces spectabilis]